MRIAAARSCLRVESAQEEGEESSTLASGIVHESAQRVAHDAGRHPLLLQALQHQRLLTLRCRRVFCSAVAVRGFRAGTTASRSALPWNPGMAFHTQ